MDNARSTTVTAYILIESGCDMVTITTHDGKVYTNTEDIKVPRNENTEMFYQFLERFRDERMQQMQTKEDTA